LLFINFNFIIIFTIIVAIKLNKKMLNLKRQFFIDALDKSYIFKNNNSNNIILNFNLLNTFFCLSNNIALQLS